MLEPLGRSQVLSYLSRLSDDYIFTLVSFEKPADLADEKAVRNLKAECVDLGIAWKPQTYHHRPRMLATAWDLLVLFWQTLRHSRRGKVRLVHCRSYIPGLAAWLCGKVTGKPFVFDMRALWPEEMVTAGRLDEKSLTYRGLKWVERRLLRNAASVVSLTEAAVEHLLDEYPELHRDRFEVITTCVDVGRFTPAQVGAAVRPLAERRPFIVGTMGTLLSGWFYLDAYFTFFRVVKQHRPDARASIVTRDDRKQVLAAARSAGVHPDDIDIVSASPGEMPALLSKMDVGVMFFAPKIGSAPTRLGESLAAGVQVVGNVGIGDLARLIERYRVGVVVDNAYDVAQLDAAARALLGRYDEIVASGACRHAAEDYFSADQGAKRYAAIYRRLDPFVVGG
nr:glycosyltransferase [Desulfopila inferna]